VRAVAAGYEVTNRIGAACVPGLVQAGGAPTGSAGAVGAAVAAALVAGHDAQGIARAVRNSAMLLPLSPFAIMTTHGELAPLHSGLAARAGFEAASLARDADAGSFVLEGDATGPGLIALLRGDPAALVPESWHGETIDAIAWKFFPACFASMSALEALLRLGPIDAGSVQTLRLRMPDRMLALVASGPDSGHLYDRLMSLRWVLGRALERGGHYDASDAGVTSAVATELAQRVEVSHDPSLDALTDHYSADLELTAKDGSVRRIAYRRPIDGEPEQPGPRGWTRVLDEPALQGKFRLLVRDAPTVLENLRLLRVA
jgi:2-methylcitrate dehydratase PrpD